MTIRHLAIDTAENMSDKDSIKANKISIASDARIKAQQRLAKEAELREKMKKDAAFLAEKEKRDKAAKDLAAVKAEQQRLLMEFQEAENRRIEKEKKTKRFFDVNSYNRRIPAPDNPVYYGNFSVKKKAWLPHGKGQFLLNEEDVKIDGVYVDGVLEGVGTINWVDGSSWTGYIHNNYMHGSGVVQLTEEQKAGLTTITKRRALARNNCIIAFQDGIVLLHWNNQHTRYIVIYGLLQTYLLCDIYQS